MSLRPETAPFVLKERGMTKWPPATLQLGLPIIAVRLKPLG